MINIFMIIIYIYIYLLNYNGFINKYEFLNFEFNKRFEVNRNIIMKYNLKCK